MLGFRHRKTEESGVYILGFGALRFFPSLASSLAAVLLLPLIAAFEEFLSSRISLSLQFRVCAVY
jgi:hypothetical protein